VTVTDCPSVYDAARSGTEFEGFVNSSASTEGINNTSAARMAVSQREMRAGINIFTAAQVMKSWSI
jgi:hypothetical protein